MSAKTMDDAAHAAVVGFVRNFDFPRVGYPNGLRETSTTETTKAKTILFHRRGTGFQDASIAHGMVNGCFNKGRTAPSSETWTLELGFDRNVSLREFEAAFSSARLSAPLDPAGAPTGTKMLIDPVEGEFLEPVEQNPSTGLQALYTVRLHWPGM